MTEPASQALNVVLMAKPPVAGRVKTRLTGPLTASQAAEIHHAMLICQLARLPELLGDAQYDLALDRTVGGEELVVAPLPWRVIDQGDGTLGDRLNHVWRGMKPDAPTVFLGCDCPDIPAHALVSISQAVICATPVVAVGPTHDGGYWTLACSRFLPDVLIDIDWGSSSVYHQTLQRVRNIDCDYRELPRWRDVDTPDDLSRLMRRLEATDEVHLVELRRQLTDICKDTV